MYKDNGLTETSPLTLASIYRHRHITRQLIVKLKTTTMAADIITMFPEKQLSFVTRVALTFGYTRDFPPSAMMHPTPRVAVVIVISNACK